MYGNEEMRVEKKILKQDLGMLIRYFYSGSNKICVINVKMYYFNEDYLHHKM